MFELVQILVDRCIALAKRREDVNRAIFVDFVVPLVADFEAVHRDYVESFRRYREMITTSPLELDTEHPVMEALRVDEVFSAALRLKIPSSSDFAHSETLGSLADAMQRYL